MMKELPSCHYLKDNFIPFYIKYYSLFVIHVLNYMKKKDIKKLKNLIYKIKYFIVKYVIKHVN